MTPEDALQIVKELVESKLAVMRQVGDEEYEEAKEAWNKVYRKAKQTCI